MTLPSRSRIRDAGGNPAKFDVITAWEVLEHIPEAKLPGLISNVRKHLNGGGIFIAWVPFLPDGDPSRGLVYHVTLKPKSWWLERWAEHGIGEVTHHPFEVQDYVRGQGQGIKNWDPRDGDGFHLVLGLTTANSEAVREENTVKRGRRRSQITHSRWISGRLRGIPFIRLM